MVTSAEQLLALIGEGESDRLEFKASFQWDREQECMNKALQKVVAKTAAAFMNAKGGHLLIGVTDDQEVVGIADDLKTLSSKDLDAFERHLRQRLTFFIGPEVVPLVGTEFVQVDGVTVACLRCPKHQEPVFVRADPKEFYVRNGNQSMPLDVQAAFDYMRTHWPSSLEPSLKPSVPATDSVARLGVDELKKMLTEVVQGEEAVARQIGERPPPWLKVGTHRVIDLFLQPLSRSRRWESVFIISPWISEFSRGACMTFEQFTNRLVEDRTTAYVVTRRPEDDWHSRAVERLASTGRANIAFVPSLHVKLYHAETNYGALALVGSANFTQQSLISRELGLLVEPFREGRKSTGT